MRPGMDSSGAMRAKGSISGMAGPDHGIAVAGGGASPGLCRPGPAPAIIPHDGRAGPCGEWPDRTGRLRSARRDSFEALTDIQSDRREIWPVVKLRVRAGESIQEAVRRFRKLCERSGLRKEMRRKAYYEKPSERRRREELKRLRKARQHQTSRV
jgi:small subunit ribosomal protein S21